MTQPAWSIEIDVDRQHLDATLTTLETRLTDAELSHWMQDHLVNHFQRRASDRFAAEGDDAVGTWDPLSPVTNIIRASRGYAPDHPINVRTGELRSFITSSHGVVSSAGGGVELQYPEDPPTAEMFDKLATAQTGRANPRTAMRPVIALGLTDYNEVMDLLSIYITEGLI